MISSLFSWAQALPHLLDAPDAAHLAIWERAEKVVDRNAPLIFSMAPIGKSIPAEVDAAIQDVINASKSGQQQAENQRFAKMGYDQYGEFIGSVIILYTPELDRESAQASATFAQQVLSIMTPEQLPQAEENLANLERLGEVCDRQGPISVADMGILTPLNHLTQ